MKGEGEFIPEQTHCSGVGGQDKMKSIFIYIFCFVIFCCFVLYMGCFHLFWFGGGFLRVWTLNQVAMCLGKFWGELVEENMLYIV